MRATGRRFALKILLLSGFSARAQANLGSSDDEVSSVQEFRQFTAMIESGRIDEAMQHVHPAVEKLAGGRKELASWLKALSGNITSDSAKITDDVRTVVKPRNADEFTCTLIRTTTTVIVDQETSETSALILAIRRGTTQDSWKFLRIPEGKQARIRKLIPELPPDFPLSDEAIIESLPEDEIRKHLLGRWSHRTVFAGIEMTGTTEYFTDGTSRIDGLTRFDDESFEFHMRATWKLSGRKLLWTITESDDDELGKVGDSGSDIILQIDDMTFRYRDENGRVVTERRAVEKKEP